MTNLESIKKEGRTEIMNAVLNKKLRDIEAAVDTFADRLLEEVERAVVPQELTGGGYDEMAEHQEGYNDCRSEVLEAFNKFKGV